jgi:hypothetical protein
LIPHPIATFAIGLALTYPMRSKVDEYNKKIPSKWKRSHKKMSNLELCIILVVIN